MAKYRVTLEGIASGEVSTLSVEVYASDETDAEDQATDYVRRATIMRDALVIQTKEL